MSSLRVQNQYSLACLVVSFFSEQECFGFVLPALPHAFDLLNDRKESVFETHQELHHGVSDLLPQVRLSRLETLNLVSDQ